VEWVLSFLIGEEDIQEWLKDTLEEADTLGDRMAVPLHEEVLDQMRAADIPVVSGDLEESLTDPSSSLHVWVEDPSGITFGSRARAAKWNPGAIPELDLDILFEIIVEAFDD